MPEKPLSDRVLAYLERAKWDEFNHGMRWYDDYAIAFLTVFYASQDSSVCRPHVRATYCVLGIHPDRVWPAIVERRKAKLGPYYSRFYDANGNWIVESITTPIFPMAADPEPPRKPVQSVRIAPPKRERAA